jgi:hypothetical protein
MLKILYHAFSFQQGLEDAPDNQLNVFAVALHAHRLGVAIKIWQIRGGNELPPIAEDKYFNFDYQNILTLPTERAIKQVGKIVF